MRHLVSIFLVLLLILTCSACHKRPLDAVSSSPDSSSEESLPSEPDVPSEEVSSSVSGFEEILKDNNLEVTETENEDGSITVELKPTAPEKDDTDDTSSKPDTAIPNIDTLPKPTPLPDEDDEDISSEVPSTEESTETDIPSDTESTDSTSSDSTSADSSGPSDNNSSEPSDETEEKKDYTYTTGQTHTSVPVEERYIYSTLSSTEKGWYEKIDRAVKNFDTKVFLNAELLESKNYYIYFMYMFDNPEHFYLSNTVGIYTLPGNRHGLLLSYSDGEATNKNTTMDTSFPEGLLDKIKAKKSSFDQKVDEIISTIPSDAPDVVKEKLIYDRIIIDAHYNLEANWNGFCEDNWNAYGVLMNGKGVCESYSEAFQLLCLKVGINCTGIVGSAGGAHKWNAVELDGEWYACDITFDDPIGIENGVAPYHYYFNITTAQMETAIHYVDVEMYPAPTCNGTKYSFQKFFGTK